MKFFIQAAVLFSALGASNPAGAATLLATPLPASIVDIIESEAKQGTCEASWRDYVSDTGLIKERLDETTTLYLVPCAHWAHNMAWTAFVTIEESTQPSGYLTLAMRFVDHSPHEGLVARSVIHNIAWSPSRQAIQARFFLNGKEQCGSIGEYRWDAGQRSFILQTLAKQDRCDGTPLPWDVIYSKSN